MSNNRQDRIRLAEAMFPDYEFGKNYHDECLMCYQGKWDRDNHISNVPDPFTDANDDYAVLEWMRENEMVPNWRTIDFLACGSYFYEIGDYARAALKAADR